MLNLLIPVLLALQSSSAVEELAAGKTAFATHDYAAAADRFRAALGGDEAIGLEALTPLAAALRLLGNPDEAEQSLKRAAPIAIRLHGGTSLEVASILSSLSSAQRALGKRKEAIQSIDSALRMRETHPTEKLAEFASDLSTAAGIRIELGHPPVAKELSIRALSTCEKALPPESPQVLRMLDALAGSHRSGPDYATT